MNNIPMEYIFYSSCGCVFTVYLISLIFNCENKSKDKDDLENPDLKCIEINRGYNIRKNYMKKSESMSIIVDNNMRSENKDERVNHLDIMCLDKIPKEKKSVKNWMHSLIQRKNTNICGNPNCLNRVGKNGVIYMAFDCKFCCNGCRSDAHLVLGNYWNK